MSFLYSLNFSWVEVYISLIIFRSKFFWSREEGFSKRKSAWRSMFTSRFEEFWEMNRILRFLWRAISIRLLRSLFGLLIDCLELKRIPPSSIRMCELFFILSIEFVVFIQEGISSFLKPIA